MSLLKSVHSKISSTVKRITFFLFFIVPILACRDVESPTRLTRNSRNWFGLMNLKSRELRMTQNGIMILVMDARMFVDGEIMNWSIILKIQKMLRVENGKLIIEAHQRREGWKILYINPNCIQKER